MLRTSRNYSSSRMPHLKQQTHISSSLHPSGRLQSKSSASRCWTCLLVLYLRQPFRGEEWCICTHEFVASWPNHPAWHNTLSVACSTHRSHNSDPSPCTYACAG